MDEITAKVEVYLRLHTPAREYMFDVTGDQGYALITCPKGMVEDVIFPALPKLLQLAVDEAWKRLSEKVDALIEQGAEGLELRGNSVVIVNAQCTFNYQWNPARELVFVQKGHELSKVAKEHFAQHVAICFSITNLG